MKTKKSNLKAKKIFIVHSHFSNRKKNKINREKYLPMVLKDWSVNTQFAHKNRWSKKIF